MNELARKEALLERAGYRYHLERMIYYNREARRVFSLEFVEDHDFDSISTFVDASPPDAGWDFRFNDPPPESVKRQLAEALGE